MSIRWFYTLCLSLGLLLSTSSSVSGHQRAEAKLHVDATHTAHTSVVLEMHEDDLGEFLYPDEHLLGALPKSLDAWRADTATALPSWATLEERGQVCALSLTTLDRVGIRGVKITARAPCVADTIRWRANEVSALSLRAATRFTASDSRTERGVLHGSTTTLSLRTPPHWYDEAARFLILGVEHIITGWDHLAFLLALVLACATLTRLFWVISGFTLAHSVTLGMGALGVVQLSGALVEPIIAASIALAAAFQLARLSRRALEHPGKESSKQDGIPWPEVALCIAFGLIHGLGFAGMLADALGEQSGDILLPTLSFNAGVELGQLGIVLLVFPGLVWVGGTKHGRAIFAVLLAGLVALGAIATILRVFG